MQLLSGLVLVLSSAVAVVGFRSPAFAPKPASPKRGCNRDNCYRQMIQNAAQASTFCPTYTATPCAGAAALPTFVSMCTGNVASRVSSACSCIVPATSASSSSISTISSSTITGSATASATPTPTPRATPTATATCRKPPVRKEWRALKRNEKIRYIAAVKCLTRLPAISGINGTISRFDDFHAVHNIQTPNIHWVGFFILWHRYFIAAYETALRDECGWTGGQPYWDWSRDADPTNPSSTAIYETDVFSATIGFGGNGPFRNNTAEQNPLGLTGRTGGGCVADGPFAYPHFTVNYPKGPKCLTRDFIPSIMNTFAAQANVDLVLASADYTAFARQIENEPVSSVPNIHGSGHFGVGGVLGTIGDASNSPGDPLFYLHHCNLDRILTRWQAVDPARRLHEVGGPVLPFDYAGVNVTLDFEIDLLPIAPVITLRQALNAEGEVFCYRYEKEKDDRRRPVVMRPERQRERTSV
ncbi:uncharacterized protein L3040_002365 [Drepanopeziza brunnea f. sp. 'multigermtubi']|uniref:uncharacterized protein n=1 Tax=Drepanopeziza brunnea f. sp. 'multigermtubi' TaxID=698441 RepID=UPI00238330F5|nr:hypothetical protein L3040_002365 [Drepanopeziza brunnea f. sp. 'multigermtubi']